MQGYRVAIVGLGRIASTIDDEVAGSGIKLPYAHMACFRAIPSVKVVAAADPYQEQRDAFRNRWGVDRVYADYREMMEREKPDIVSVATSAKPRAGIVSHLAKCGVRAIYAEKPISFSLAEADQMCADCQANGVKLAIGAARNWDVDWTTVRDLIAQGEIGRPLHINASWNCALSHNGSHLITLVRFLAGGHVSWVFGEMEGDEKAALDDDLHGDGYLAFDNGVRALVRTWRANGNDVDVVVEGETGRIVSNGRYFEWWQARNAPQPRGFPRVMDRQQFPHPRDAESPHLRALLDLIDCVENGGEPACSGEDAREALEVAIALRESHRRGGVRVDLPLADRGLKIASAETLRGDLPRALERVS